MRELYLFLSGNVPGGFLLLSFVLLTVNMALYFLFKNSGLFSREVYKKKVLRYNFFVLSAYVFLWIYLQPPRLPARIGFLPWQAADSIDLKMCTALELATRDAINEGYFLHSWTWFYETANPDSIHRADYRHTLTQRLDFNQYVTGKISENASGYNLTVQIISNGDTGEFVVKSAHWQQGLEQVLQYIKNSSDLLDSYSIPDYSPEQLDMLTRTRVAYIRGNNHPGLGLLNHSDVNFDIQLARELIQKGLSERKKTKKSILRPQEININFQKAQNLLIGYSREEKDTAELNVVLARLYMFKGDYETAEICLKRARSQNRYDARVYFHMSFLHQSRFADLGFTDRKEILEESIRIDPGYANAVYELANEYYSTGAGTPTGYSTITAKKILNEYLAINSTTYNVLSLMGRIQLQSKFTREATEIFEQLLNLYPDVAESYYNLGICYYHFKNYARAEQLFKKAIELTDDTDSYLYLGAIYKQQEKYDLALEYFRERVRRKLDHDDYYAKEAMRQIRIILSMQQDSLQVNNEGPSDPNL